MILQSFVVLQPLQMIILAIPWFITITYSITSWLNIYIIMCDGINKWRCLDSTWLEMVMQDVPNFPRLLLLSQCHNRFQTISTTIATLSYDDRCPCYKWWFNNLRDHQTTVHVCFYFKEVSESVPLLSPPLTPAAINRLFCALRFSFISVLAVKELFSLFSSCLRGMFNSNKWCVYILGESKHCPPFLHRTCFKPLQLFYSLFLHL